MADNIFILEFFYCYTESITLGIEIGNIDLIRIACQNYLRTFSCPGDDRFHFMWCKVLGFIYYDELIRQASSPDIGQGFQFDKTEVEVIFQLWMLFPEDLTVIIILLFIPVEKQISAEHKPLPYQQMTAIIESSQSFAVNECVCNKEKKLLGKGCDKPKEICMGLSQEPNAWDNHPWGRPITREEAFQILDKAEEEALVHLSTNVEKGHWFICNCCKCCCPVLEALTMFESSEHVNSSYYAVIDPDTCSACGVCADERCQVNAIEESDDTYNIIMKKCIGCGLCISTCPEEAIELIRKPEDQIRMPAKNDDFWFEERGRQRGVDFSMYK